MAKKTVYQLLFSFEAPDKLKSEQAGRVITEFFEEEEMVIGEPYLKDKIIVEDRYIIPLDYVEKTDKFPYLKKHSKLDETINRIKEQSVQMSDKESQKLSKVGTDVKGVIEGTTKAKVIKEAASYKNGALIGLASGVLFALYTKRSVWTFGLIGVAVGGYVAHKIHKAKQGNSTIKPIT